jgi:hypothetical protein
MHSVVLRFPLCRRRELPGRRQLLPPPQTHHVVPRELVAVRASQRTDLSPMMGVVLNDVEHH